MITSSDSDMMARQAKKQARKKANKKENIFVFYWKRFRSGGEENERQMANNVSAKDEIL